MTAFLFGFIGFLCFACVVYVFLKAFLPDIRWAPSRGSTRTTALAALCGNAIRRKDGGWMRGYSLTVAETMLSDDGKLDRLCSDWIGLLSAKLPPGSTFTFRREFLPDEGGRIQSLFQTTLSRSMNPFRRAALHTLAYLSGQGRARAFLRDSHTLWVSIPFAASGDDKHSGLAGFLSNMRSLGPWKAFKAFILEGFVQRGPKDEQAMLRAFEDACSQLELNAAVPMQRLGAGDTLAELCRSHRPGTATVPTPNSQTVYLPSVLCQNEIRYRNWYVEHDGVPMAVVSMVEPPHVLPERENCIQADVTRGMLCSLPFRMTYVVEYIVLDQERTRKKLDLRRKGLKFAANASSKNVEEIEESLAVVGSVRRALARPGSTAIHCRSYFLVYGRPYNDSEEKRAVLAELNSARRQVFEIVERMDGAVAAFEEGPDLQALYERLLIGESDPDDETRVHFERCSALAPLICSEGPWLGVDRPHMLVPTVSGRLFGISLLNGLSSSLFSLLVGTTGSGKSVLGALLLETLAAQHDAILTLLDFGSFADWCSMLGGQFVRFDQATINPFHYDGLESGIAPERFQRQLIVRDVLNLAGPEHDTSVGRGIIDEAVLLTFQNPVAHNADNDEKIIPQFRDFLTMLQRVRVEPSLEPTRSILVTVLKPFLGHPVIDAQTSPELFPLLNGSARLVCFDMLSLKVHDDVVRQALAFRVAAFASSFLVAGGEVAKRVKGLLFDEFQEVRDNYPQIYSAIEICARTGRKARAVACLLSQSFSDFQPIRGVVNNAGTIFVGQQSVAYDDLQADFQMTPMVVQSIDAIRNQPGRYAEWIIGQGAGTGRKWERLKIQVDPLHRWALANDGDATNAKVTLRRLLPRCTEAQRLGLLAEWFPEGLAAVGLTADEINWQRLLNQFDERKAA